jgi:hypothetical protein
LTWGAPIPRALAIARCPPTALQAFLTEALTWVSMAANSSIAIYLLQSFAILKKYSNALFSGVG